MGRKHFTKSDTQIKFVILSAAGGGGNIILCNFLDPGTGYKAKGKSALRWENINFASIRKKMLPQKLENLVFFPQ